MTAPPLPAQDAGRDVAPGRIARDDSLRWRRRARRAQARLESVRLRTLPWGPDASPGRACDEVVGRICLWEDDAAERQWQPAPDGPSLVAARDAFLRLADSAAARLPGDGWIAGQRVRYLVEAGRDSLALEAARRCAAARWWCDALAGYALHRAARYAAADSAFALALERQPPAERRGWSDLSVLLDRRARAQYRRMAAADRTALERRFWWLADPLYVVPGNDRRTEHMARLVLDALQEGARTPDGLTWGRDSREILLRNGWPRGWERTGAPGPGERPGVVSHTAPDSPRLLPPWGAVRSLAALGDSGWPLATGARRSEYVPAYATRFEELPRQLARFPRGDSLRVVAAVALGAPSADTVLAALVIATDERAPVVLARVAAWPAARTATLALTVPDAGAVVSVEVLRTAERRAMRARVWLAPLAVRAAPRVLSDLLLFAPGDTAPVSLEQALARAWPAPRVRAGEAVGLYWELTSREPAATALTLTLRALRRPLAQRVAVALGLRRGTAPVRVRWTERVQGAASGAAAGAAPSAVRAAPPGRSLVIRLPATLPPGEYLLRLEAGGAPRAAERRLQVVR